MKSDCRELTEPEPAHLDHVIADEELARVVGGADHTGRADLSSLSIQKLLDKAS
jgi:hypothetical protein